MRYFITSLKLQFYLLLFVVVVLVKRQNLIFFYIVLNMLLQEKKSLSAAACSCFSNEWSRYSDSQEVNFFLFGSSHLSTEENVELFFYAQQFIKESKRFCFFYLKGIIYS